MAEGVGGAVGELAADALRSTLGGLGFTHTGELPELTEGVIGQERATQALEFGLVARGAAYNVYVAGPVGTGRSTFVRSRLAIQAGGMPVPPDLCYVYNFEQPSEPRLLVVPPGEGRRMERAMTELVVDLHADLRRTFDSEEYETHRQAVGLKFAERSQELATRLETQARAAGFFLKRTSTGFVSGPLGPQGKPLSPEEFELLPPERQEMVRRASQTLQAQVGEIGRELRQLERDEREELRALDRETAAYVIEHLIGGLRAQFAAHAAIQDYLNSVAADVLEQLDLFRPERPDRGNPEAEILRGGSLEVRYRINVFVDNGQASGAPVVFEPNPTAANLAGRVEYRGGMNGMFTGHDLLRPGALQRANGGFLVLPLRELLSAPRAFNLLKRALKDRAARVEDPSAGGLLSLATVNPEAIPLDLKVVLIGPGGAYQALVRADEDFRKLFKVKVEFQPDMLRTAATEASVASFVGMVCKREQSPHFDAPAVAQLLHYSSRLAGDRRRLSTRFSEIVDLIVSAGIAARRRGALIVGADDVLRALADQRERHNQVEERLREMVRSGSLRVATSGSVTAQVNGLAVFNLGDYAFGHPVRITARTWMGRSGVLNIERESALSGPIHTKGVLTLAAFLAGVFAQERPLGLSASLALEQSYEEIEGDSASSAELYALLSALAEVGIDQGIAVTGSVDQWGNIQPIGGVNEKVEGFFRVCRDAGLTGRQGVLIPAANVDNLVPDPEVIAAVAAGRFHIWPVRSVSEGLTVLTGVAAGERRADGSFPPETIFQRIDQRLADYQRRLEGREGTGDD